MIFLLVISLIIVYLFLGLYIAAMQKKYFACPNKEMQDGTSICLVFIFPIVIAGWLLREGTINIVSFFIKVFDKLSASK